MGMERVLVLYAIASKLACLYIRATPTHYQRWGEECDFLSCEQLGVAKLYVTKQQSVPSCNFVDYYMCGHLLYHYPQHTHTLCVY